MLRRRERCPLKCLGHRNPVAGTQVANAESEAFGVNKEGELGLKLVVAATATDLVPMDVALFTDKAWQLEQDLSGLSSIVERRIAQFGDETTQLVEADGLFVPALTKAVYGSRPERAFSGRTMSNVDELRREPRQSSGRHRKKRGPAAHRQSVRRHKAHCLGMIVKEEP